MKINFVIPSYPLHPGGGHKIMYEYANRFAMAGDDVMIYHVMTLPGEHYRTPDWFRNLRGKLFYGGAPSWYTFCKKVKFTCISHITKQSVRDADITISTQWLVATQVAKLPQSKGKKVNLIQGYETWIGNDVEGLHQSYTLPMIQVVISDFLFDVVSKYASVPPKIIYNAVDADTFRLEVPIEQRKPHTISMLYSEQEAKGSCFGLEALRIAKEAVKDLHVEMFGVSNAPEGLENWIHYRRCPDNLCKLYNSTAIFMTPSLKEGWGLPATEAMFCGCALVCTRVEGHLVFAHNNQTALVVEPSDAKALADALLRLLVDDELRLRLATEGNRYIQRFEWKESYGKMRTLFSSLL